MYQALYRKWRPRTFDDVVGQGHITNTLKRQVAAGKSSHAYLFTGTRGTGKTSCAKIIARAVNCEQPMDGNPCNQCPACHGIENGSIMDVLELDAASNNGVDQIRALRDEAIYTPAAVRKRVYIVDEVHMLTTAAFNALLKILEEPPEHLMFVLATTELHKVPATIKSRCQQFAFKRLAPQDIAAQLLRISEAEGIELTSEGASLLSRLANGGMRDAISLFDQCAGAGGRLDEAEILNHLSLAGNSETARLLSQLADGDPGGALATFAGLYEAGREAGSILNELSALLRDLLIRSAAPIGGEGLLTGGYDSATLKELLAKLETGRLLSMLTMLQQGSAQLARSPNPRIDAEVCLVKLCGVPMSATPVMSAPSAQVRTQTAPKIPAAPMAKPALLKEVKPSPPSSEEERPPLPEEPPFPDEPPFDMDEPVRAPVAPPKPVPTPAPKLEPKPAPAPARAEPMLGEMDWNRLVREMSLALPSSMRGLFANPGQLFGRLEGDVLHLFVEVSSSEMNYNLVARPKNLKLVEEQCAKIVGRPIRCRIERGLPPEAAHSAPISSTEPAGSFDALLSLSELDGVTIED